MRLTIAIVHFTRVIGIPGTFEIPFQQLNRVIQIKAIHIAGVNMQLADQPGADPLPILFQVVTQIVSLPVFRDRRIDFTGHFIEQGFDITIITNGTINRLENIDLFAGAIFSAPDQFIPVSLLISQPDNAIGAAVAWCGNFQPAEFFEISVVIFININTLEVMEIHWIGT